jgi:hypothetical protein
MGAVQALMAINLVVSVRLSVCVGVVPFVSRTMGRLDSACCFFGSKMDYLLIKWKNLAIL